MIVDCHTCIWQSRGQLGRGSRRSTGPFPARTHAGAEPPDYAGADRHEEATQPVDAAFVLAFKSLYLDADVPNQLVSDYIRTNPRRLIGFAAVDPTEPRQAVEDLHFAHAELNMRGVSLSPAAQNFHPCHTNAKPCYEAAAKLEMPIVFHTGFRDGPEVVLQYAQPSLLDEVAREFPTLRIIIAHMGYPWIQETIVMLAKHPYVYTDISWLLHQPWQAYQALVSAYQFGVIDKLLFGSGFPYTHPAQSIEALYGINQIAAGTSLPTIPREKLRGIVERDVLDLLGIHASHTNRNADSNESLLDDED